MLKRLLGVLVCALALLAVSPSATAASRPNVLIIVTDDQRAGLEAMPATRRLFKRQGIFFKHAYVTDPLCCPSRASIMTGRYPHNTGVKSNAPHRALGVGAGSALDASTTIQHYLHDEGYTTALFGKYLNGWDLDKPPPFFDTYAVIKTNDYIHSLVSAGHGGERPTVSSTDIYTTTVLRRRALRFLREHADPAEPFFLYVAPHAPHPPFRPEEKYAQDTFGSWNGNPAVFEIDLSDKPPYVADRTPTRLPAARRIRTKQFRMLESVDGLVTRIFRQLRATRQARNTLAFFTSDNGYMWGEHALRRKNVPYLPSVEVPLFLRWPAGPLARGTVDTRRAANVDLAPTVMDAAGLTIPRRQPRMDGRSLLRAWQRTRQETEHWCGASKCSFWAAEQTRTYHYIEYYDGPDFDAANVIFREYYDLTNDPFELQNLLHDRDPTNNPDVTAAAAQLASDRNCVAWRCP
jgi:arylsulfatase A-like enzyme